MVRQWPVLAEWKVKTDGSDHARARSIAATFLSLTFFVDTV